MANTNFGVVANPQTITIPDNTEQYGLLFGKAGETLVSEVRGKYYTPNYRGTLYSFSVNAVTLPVNAATLASKFALLNPAGSGKNLELISAAWGYALATTVVNCIGLYSNPIGAATLTTPGTVASMNFGSPAAASVATPYTAMTCVGTPVQVANIGYTGAVTSSAVNVNEWFADGTIIIPPGYGLHVAMTVAASTASGFSGTLTWAEHLI